MKVYKPGSAAYSRQKETQRFQRIAAAKQKPERRTDGKKYLYPERHRKYGGYVNMETVMKND